MILENAIICYKNIPMIKTIPFLNNVQELVHTYNEIVSVVIDGCIQIVLPLFQP